MSNTGTRQQQEAAYTVLSPDTNPALMIEAFMQTVIGDDQEGFVDPLDKRVVALLNLPRTLQIQYDSSQRITSISQQYYRTVSCWWLIVACSGYLHAHQIPNKHRFLIPSVTAVASMTRQEEKKNVGKKIIY